MHRAEAAKVCSPGESQLGTSPFIFRLQGQTIIPAESVYAVFEAKQSINAAEVEYAQKKGHRRECL